MRPTAVAKASDIPEKEPYGILVENVDLVLVKDGAAVYCLYGRCLHRGALLADGAISGEDIICGVHHWDFRYKTGVSAYNNKEVLPTFRAWTKRGTVLVDADEIAAWAKEHPQPFPRDEYLGTYADTHPIDAEDKVGEIQHLAKYGLSQVGHHGFSDSMGVPRTEVPRWDDIQVLTAQLRRSPLLDEEPVGTEVMIGPKAAKPLRLETPLFVSDMSFGALSEEAKISLAKGAEMAGTGICSGEGGMLDDEQAANSRYFYELASAKFGYSEDKLTRVQAFHFKAGQGAKTGTGGHLPGNKVQGRIAEVRGL
ncbi:MAG: glutamate synthase-related protein, partial [Verrucomicrobiota bacterium]